METKQADRIAISLEEMILTGQFLQGERLDEASLAERFGVSRTPIRQALQIVVEAGLAIQVPRRGVFVQQPNSMALIEMFETMAELEGVCARLAASRMSQEDYERLERINARCVAAVENDDAKTYSEANEDFHHALYRMADNGFLEKQAKSLFKLLKPFRRIQFQIPGRMRASMSEHLALLAALKTGVASEAAQLSRVHIATQGERFYNHMSKLRRERGMQATG